MGRRWEEHVRIVAYRKEPATHGIGIFEEEDAVRPECDLRVLTVAAVRPWLRAEAQW